MTSSPPPGQLGPHLAERRAGGGGAIRRTEGSQEAREAPGGDPKRASATSHSIVRDRAEGGGEGEDRGEAGEGRRPREGRAVELRAAGCSGPATAGNQQGRTQKHKQGGRVQAAARPPAGKCPPAAPRGPRVLGRGQKPEDRRPGNPMRRLRRGRLTPAPEHPDGLAGTSPARRRRSPSAAPHPPARNQKPTLHSITPGVTHSRIASLPPAPPPPSARGFGGLTGVLGLTVLSTPPVTPGKRPHRSTPVSSFVKRDSNAASQAPGRGADGASYNGLSQQYLSR